MLTDIRALADHFLIALPNINTRPGDTPACMTDAVPVEVHAEHQ